MLPFLAALSDRQEHNIRDLRKQLASQFKLTDQELEERIPSNRALLFDNRVGWARTYLGKAGLIDFVKRGTYRITPRGIALLKTKPQKLDVALLKQFPEFLDFLKPKGDGHSNLQEISDQPEAETPLEVLDGAYVRLRRELADDLLQAVRYDLTCVLRAASRSGPSGDGLRRIAEGCWSSCRQNGR